MLCLTRPTDPRWLETALARFDEVLADHAHCEMKAASNAMALAARATAWPAVVTRLVDLAEEELSHFRRVVAMLERRNVPLGPPPVDPYAVELRKLVQRQPSSLRGVAGALADRMLVAALIEARSCERFRLLRDGLRSAGRQDLWPFYDELLAAEAGHFRAFVDLAVDLVSRGDAGIEPDAARGYLRGRLSALADAEGELCARLDARATIHG